MITGLVTSPNWFAIYDGWTHTDSSSLFRKLTEKQTHKYKILGNLREESNVGRSGNLLLVLVSTFLAPSPAGLMAMSGSSATPGDGTRGYTDNRVV